MPPFYAVELHPGLNGTSTGLHTDEHARVLRADGSAIAGLYACGNDMGSMMEGTYPGPGITIGPALVFAYSAVADMLAHDSKT
jgi:predicted oxidoreductase